MSVAANPKGNPVKPPKPNIGRKARAKSMGVVKRIFPPQRVMNRDVMMIIDGMEMIIVVVWKNAVILVPIPVK